MTDVVKLGGSVITDKASPETLDASALDAAAAAVAAADPLVLVHGGGSFGHHHAAAHGVTRTEGTHDAVAVAAIHDAMRRLNAAVVDALHDHGAPGLPVHPLSMGARGVDGSLDLPTAAVAGLLDEGFVPVLHGDVVAHTGEGVTVVSGDEVVAAVAAALDADRVGLCTGVPGVLDADGNVIGRIRSPDEVADVLGGSGDTDVTGGMAGKVRAILDVDVPAWIFGAPDLPAFLDGGGPGTRIG